MSLSSSPLHDDMQELEGKVETTSAHEYESALISGTNFVALLCTFSSAWMCWLSSSMGSTLRGHILGGGLTKPCVGVENSPYVDRQMFCVWDSSTVGFIDLRLKMLVKTKLWINNHSQVFAWVNVRQIMWDALKAHCIIMGLTAHHDHQLIQRNTCLDGTWVATSLTMIQDFTAVWRRSVARF